MMKNMLMADESCNDTPAHHALCLVIGNTVLSLFFFFALYFIPPYWGRQIQSSWMLPLVLGFSILHYMIRIRQAPHSPHFKPEHLVPDSKDIMLITNLLTVVNVALSSTLWFYGGLDASPVVLLVPSYFLFAFAVTHLVIAYLVWKRVKPLEAIATFMNTYSFLSCVIGVIRMRTNIQG